MTAVEVRNLKRPGFHTVGGVAGLILQVGESGARSWVLRASVAGKVRHMGLGSYEDVSLARAREKAREARDAISEGRDPIEERKRARQELAAARAKRMTFADAARACYEAKAPGWREGSRKRDWLSSLENHAFPIIGGLDVSEIEHADVMQVLKPIWTTKTQTATNVRQRIEAVLTWAQVSGHRSSSDNPARWVGNLKEVLATPSKIHKVKHHRALPWSAMPKFMTDLRERAGMSARALEFVILTAARSGEVREATWAEIDLDTKLWTVPGERIKSGRRHQVPLSDDAITILQEVPRFEGSRFVFPAPRGGALSDMSLSAVTRRMGVNAVPHGFRSSFKDWARNRSAYADEVSELALAHVSSDATRAAYARDELLPQRARMMADWSHFVRHGDKEAEVVGIGEARATASDEG